MSTDEMQNVKSFTFREKVKEKDIDSVSQSTADTKKNTNASRKTISPDDDGVYLSPKTDVSDILAKEHLKKDQDNVSDTSKASTSTASLNYESELSSKENKKHQNQKQALPRSTKSKEQSVQDIYDENHYCLARSSSVVYVDDSKQIQEGEEDVKTAQPEPKKYLTKNKILICQAVGNVCLIGVVVYLLATNQGKKYI